MRATGHTQLILKFFEACKALTSSLQNFIRRVVISLKDSDVSLSILFWKPSTYVPPSLRRWRFSLSSTHLKLMKPTIQIFV